MDISVPSRFACLNIEDDEYRPVNNNNKSTSKKKLDNKVQKKSNVNNINNGDGNIKKGTVKPVESNTGQKKNKAKGKQSVKQWEEWKKKDDEFVDGNFEEDMKCAILQSKLDFEAQKKKGVKSDNTQTQNKKKKSKTMSLDQFLENNTAKLNGSNSEKKIQIDDPAFFEKAAECAKQEIKKEKVERKRKERQVNIEEVITSAQYHDKLELERKKNHRLEQELEKARAEIKDVRERNIILNNMLGQGEMKDKAKLLMELESLNNDKAELMQEVTNLHTLLEQERSKSNTNTESHTNKKDKQKRKK